MFWWTLFRWYNNCFSFSGPWGQITEVSSMPQNQQEGSWVASASALSLKFSMLKIVITWECSDPTKIQSVFSQNWPTKKKKKAGRGQEMEEKCHDFSSKYWPRRLKASLHAEFTHAHVHTHAHARPRTCTARTLSLSRAHMHAHTTHAHARPRTHKHRHAHALVHTRTRNHKRTHARTLTLMHAHSHSCTHTHAL